MQPAIAVNRSSPVPLYFQVAEQMERAIQDGTLAPGSRITNEISLAAELGLSRPTMRQAIQLLVDKGMLVRKRGVGTQVVQGVIHRPVELTSLYDDLVRAGREPTTEVLSCVLTSCSESVAAELKVASGVADTVWCVERLRSVGGEPLALLHNYVPAAVIDLGTVDLVAEGLYAALLRHGLRMRVARQQIGARRADSREAQLLGEPPGGPLLTMRRTAFDDAGRAVEFGTHVYRPGRYTFDITLVDR